jgi:hypothetical protein
LRQKVPNPVKQAESQFLAMSFSGSMRTMLAYQPHQVFDPENYRVAQPLLVYAIVSLVCFFLFQVGGDSVKLLIFEASSVSIRHFLQMYILKQAGCTSG